MEGIKMMLEVGTKAPEFSLLNQNGETLSLSDFKGKKVVLYAYPKDDTPGCTIEAQAFTALSDEFAAANTVVLGISKDSVESHSKFCQKYDLNVQLLSDPDMVVLEPYGIWREKKNYGKTYMGIVRCTYIISEDGVVEKLWKSVKVKGHAESVLKAVKGA